MELFNWLFGKKKTKSCCGGKCSNKHQLLQVNAEGNKEVTIPKEAMPLNSVEKIAVVKGVERVEIRGEYYVFHVNKDNDQEFLQALWKFLVRNE